MRIVDAPLAVRVYARFADTLRLLSDGAWWQTPMSRPGYVLGAVVVLTYVTTLRAALWLGVAGRPTPTRKPDGLAAAECFRAHPSQYRTAPRDQQRRGACHRPDRPRRPGARV